MRGERDPNSHSRNERNFIGANAGAAAPGSSGGPLRRSTPPTTPPALAVGTVRASMRAVTRKLPSYACAG